MLAVESGSIGADAERNKLFSRGAEGRASGHPAPASPQSPDRSGLHGQHRPEPFAQRSPYPLAIPSFSLTANYQWSNCTYGKMIDSGAAGQNMYDRRPKRGLSDSDIRPNFIGGFVDDLPVGKGRKIDIQNKALIHFM
jgi:hypothetical protein